MARARDDARQEFQEWTEIAVLWKSDGGRSIATGRLAGWLLGLLGRDGWRLMLLPVESDSERAPWARLVLAPPSEEDRGQDRPRGAQRQSRDPQVDEDDPFEDQDEPRRARR